MAATNNLAYRVNHHQRILRPQDPQTLDFQLDLNHVDDGFVRGDIHVQQKRHIVVASDYQMELLCNATRWFVDGTFKLVMAPFTPLWSVHAFVRHGTVSKQIPLVFVLMSARRQADYDAVIGHILGMMQWRSVQIISADYEAAMWQSVRGLLSNIRLVGCLFHYSQALHRQIQALGLQRAYQTDMGTKSLARCFMALPVLPPEHIPQVFNNLAASSPPQFRSSC